MAVSKLLQHSKDVTHHCRFAVISDPHVALPHTIWDSPNRLHLVEVSIPALEQILERLESLEIDFLLMPGDLTQHGEPDNHHWLADRLARLPFPVYVIPGNHDFPARTFADSKISQDEFIKIYRNFGYQESGHLPYYHRQIFPGIRLIGLNSNQLSADGRWIEGRIDVSQMEWLDRQLAACQRDYPDDLVLAMVHHNLAEHIPHQSTHPLGQRYILPKVDQLQKKLRDGGVKCVFTGHLHVQDITETAAAPGLHAITTGSLVAYPHPYRILNLYGVETGEGELGETRQQRWLAVESHRVESLPGWPDLGAVSWQWAGDHSGEFMTQLLAKSSLNLSEAEAAVYSTKIRHLWAEVSAGDRQLSFPDLPNDVRDYCENFGVRSRNNQMKFTANHIAFRLD